MFDEQNFHLFPEDKPAVPAEREPTGDPGTFRPPRLKDIIGQDQLTKRLATHVGYAVAAGEQPGHVMITGQSGFGKTSIANTLSSELCALGVTSIFHETMADTLDTVKKLALVLAECRDGDVLLIDEIHTLRPKIAYALYKCLEDRVLVVSGGPKDAPQTLPIPKITIVGATTHPGKMLAALKNRFKFTGQVNPYSPADLTRVLLGYAERSGVAVTDEAARAVAVAARFTPRLAIEHLSACRAYAWEMTQDANAKIDLDTAKQGLEYAEVDPHGFNARDHRVMRKLAEEFKGGPIGIKPLATALGMEMSELTNDVLPYLIQTGVWRQTGRGQCATKGTFLALGRTVPPLINGM